MKDKMLGQVSKTTITPPKPEEAKAIGQEFSTDAKEPVADVGTAPQVKGVGVRLNTPKNKELPLFDINKQLEQLGLLVQNIKKINSSIDPDMPEQPTSQALDRLQKVGPQQMAKPSFPKALKEQMVAGALAGMVGDIMQTIVSGITGEPMTAPAASTIAMNVTSDMILGDIAKHDALVEKINAVNFEMEAQHERNILTALDRLESRTDNWEQQKLATYIQRKSIELQGEQWKQNALMTSANMDFNLRAQQFGSATDQVRFSADQELTRVSIKNREKEINAELAWKTLQLNLGLQSAYQNSLAGKGVNAAKQAEEMAVSAQVLDASVGAIAKGANLIANAHPLTEAADTLSRRAVTEAETVYSAMLNKTENPQVAEAAQLAFLRTVSALCQNGTYIEEKSINSLREKFITEKITKPLASIIQGSTASTFQLIAPSEHSDYLNTTFRLKDEFKAPEVGQMSLFMLMQRSKDSFEKAAKASSKTKQ